MITGIIGAASGALGGVLGGIGRNRALRKQMAMLNEQKAENQNWYDRRYNEDATQRADAQAALTRLREMINERNRQAAGAAAVAGGTEESVAATKAANAQAMANATSDIAQAGEQRKDQIEGQYMSRKQALDSQLQALQGQKKSALDIASDAVGGGVQGFAQGYNIDLTKDYNDMVGEYLKNKGKKEETIS